MSNALYVNFTEAWDRYINLANAVSLAESDIAAATVKLNKAKANIVPAKKALEDTLAALTKEYGAPAATPPVIEPPVVITPPPVPVDSVVLDKFKATDSIFQQYSASVWHPIVGAQPGKLEAGTAFKYEALSVNAAGELVHTLNNTDAAGIKWEAEKRLKRTHGHYMVEATFIPVKPGVVYNPLWLYSEGSAEGGHEFDFEYMNGRLEYNLHNGSGGFTMKSVEKDLSNLRCRWEIIRRPGKVTMRVTASDGWSDELIITPEAFAVWATKAGAPANLRFPPDTIPMFPLTELWIANQGWGAPNNIWSGKWVPFAADEKVLMVIHGYKFAL